MSRRCPPRVLPRAFGDPHHTLPRGNGTPLHEEKDHEMFLTRHPAAALAPSTRNGRHPRDAARFDGVREGGVEPPRPCGHWNLNPARLPIPPPAHWVCLPRPAPFGALRLPTPRTLARWSGWIHIPFPAAVPPPPTGPHEPGSPRPASPGPRRRGGDRFTYQPRTGSPRLYRSRTESTAGCGTLVCGPLYDPWQNDAHEHDRRSSKRGPGGNFVRRRHPSTGPTGGTSRSTGAWIRSVSSTR